VQGRKKGEDGPKARDRKDDFSLQRERGEEGKRKFMQKDNANDRKTQQLCLAEACKRTGLSSGSHRGWRSTEGEERSVVITGLEGMGKRWGTSGEETDNLRYFKGVTKVGH